VRDERNENEGEMQLPCFTTASRSQKDERPMQRMRLGGKQSTGGRCPFFVVTRGDGKVFEADDLPAAGPTSI
jgi:hypothetical protein